jgi:hypothetical protein
VGAFIFFFFSFTLAEILFSACYYYLAGRVDLTLVLGAVIYIATMLVAYAGCRAEQYREKRQALIDSLCQ